MILPTHVGSRRERSDIPFTAHSLEKGYVRQWLVIRSATESPPPPSTSSETSTMVPKDTMKAVLFNSRRALQQDSSEGHGLATPRLGSPGLADSYQTDVSDDMERFNLASTASAQGAVTSLFGRCSSARRLRPSR